MEENVPVRVRTLWEVTGGDAFELVHAHRWPGPHWQPDSLYLDDDTGMQALAPYLSRVFPGFDPFGPNRIPCADWERLCALCQAEEPVRFASFFDAVRRWLEENRGADHFWILGI
ncbi:MAG: hypothetical protein KH009_07980 [Clostridiales bacterium]|nr:hypothetical protein [Clostridiales bacterium]